MDIYILKDPPFYPWAIGGLFYIFGAVSYAARCPEKQFPKVFDIIGNSHSIFHVCVVIGCAIHFKEGFNLFVKSHDKVCPIDN